MLVLGYQKEAEEIAKLPLSALSIRRQQDAEKIATALVHQSAETWEQLLNDAHVPAARIRPIEEVLKHPQIRQRQVLQRAANSSRDTPVAGFDYDEEGPRLNSAPPAHGEHTQAILSELGYSLEQQQAWLADGVAKQA